MERVPSKVVLPQVIEVSVWTRTFPFSKGEYCSITLAEIETDIAGANKRVICGVVCVVR